jgi:hypothetical protein
MSKPLANKAFLVNTKSNAALQFLKLNRRFDEPFRFFDFPNRDMAMILVGQEIAKREENFIPRQSPRSRLLALIVGAILQILLEDYQYRSK